MWLTLTDFVPVVEDHDVLLRYKHEKQKLYQNIQDLVSRQPLDSTASGDRLCEDTIRLVQNIINNILRRSDPIDQDLPIPVPQLQEHSAMQLSESIGEFINLTNEANETNMNIFGSDGSNGIFSSLQYMTPASGQGMLVSQEDEQCTGNSPNMAFPPVYLTPQEMGQAYHYTGESVTYCDLTNAMTKPSFWPSIPIRHTTSLPGDLQTPTTGNINFSQNFAWNLPLNHSNYNETGTATTFYYDDKDQFPTLPTNHMQ